MRKVASGKLEDLRVKYVSEEMADKPGRWAVVESNEDFKIRFMKKGGDFIIREVSVNEGCLIDDSKEKP